MSQKKIPVYGDRLQGSPRVEKSLSQAGVRPFSGLIKIPTSGNSDTPVLRGNYGYRETKTEKQYGHIGCTEGREQAL